MSIYEPERIWVEDDDEVMKPLSWSSNHRLAGRYWYSNVKAKLQFAEAQNKTASDWPHHTPSKRKGDAEKMCQ